MGIASGVFQSRVPIPFFPLACIRPENARLGLPF